MLCQNLPQPVIKTIRNPYKPLSIEAVDLAVKNKHRSKFGINYFRKVVAAVRLNLVNLIFAVFVLQTDLKRYDSAVF